MKRSFRSRFQARAAVCGEPMLEHFTPDGEPPCYRPIKEFLENCSLWEAHAVWKDGSLWEGSTLEQGQRVTMKEKQRGNIVD